MTLPRWLRTVLTVALGLVARNNKLPMELPGVIIDEAFPTREDTQK